LLTIFTWSYIIIQCGGVIFLSHRPFAAMVTPFP
jgi:hypothetical protein